MSQDIAELKNTVVKQNETIEKLTKGFNAVVERLSKTRAADAPSNTQVYGAPNARRGEDSMSSRGFSFMKMLGVLTGAVQPSEAKVEMDVHNRLHGCLVGRSDGYEYKGIGAPPGMVGGKFLAPLATSFFHEGFVDNNFRREMRQMVRAGTEGTDPEEMNWVAKKAFGTKALSWLSDLNGGALVPPPEFGELIELLRNKEAMINAGARVIPLPPQGRLKFPRQTAPSSAYWIGENQTIADSDIGVGEIILQAKKLAVRIIAPNELIRFASPAAEALMRDDMTKTLALALDLAALEGLGGDNQPLGMISRPDITRISSSSQTANGDRVVAQDIYRMIAAVEEGLEEFETFLMRPKTLYKYYQLRFDAVAQGDAAGGFLFNLIREAQDGCLPALAGYPVVKSTQVSQVRTKGTSSNLTYVLGGAFSEVLLGMFGAIEFAATTQSDGAFTRDQTWVRGILSADVNIRHPQALVLLDNLDTTLS